MYFFIPHDVINKRFLGQIHLLKQQCHDANLLSTQWCNGRCKFSGMNLLFSIEELVYLTMRLFEIFKAWNKMQFPLRLGSLFFKGFYKNKFQQMPEVECLLKILKMLIVSNRTSVFISQKVMLLYLVHVIFSCNEAHRKWVAVLDNDIFSVIADATVGLI